MHALNYEANYCFFGPDDAIQPAVDADGPRTVRLRTVRPWIFRPQTFFHITFRPRTVHSQI